MKTLLQKARLFSAALILAIVLPSAVRLPEGTAARTPSGVFMEYQR